MSVFIDTSGFYALLDSSDRRHREAARIWAFLLDSGADLATHNYVIAETAALAQRRLGRKAAGSFFDGLLPVVRVLWIDEGVHRRAEAALKAAADPKLSLVDCVSFEIMRGRTIDDAFAFDAHFQSAGFALTKA